VCCHLDEAQQAEALQMLTAVLEFEEHQLSAGRDTGYTDTGTGPDADITGTEADDIIDDAGPVHHHHHHQCSSDHSVVARVCQSLAMLYYLLNMNHKVINESLNK